MLSLSSFGLCPSLPFPSFVDNPTSEHLYFWGLCYRADLCIGAARCMEASAPLNKRSRPSFLSPFPSKKCDSATCTTLTATLSLLSFLFFGVQVTNRYHTVELPN